MYERWYKFKIYELRDCKHYLPVDIEHIFPRDIVKHQHRKSVSDST